MHNLQTRYINYQKFRTFNFGQKNSIFRQTSGKYLGQNICQIFCFSLILPILSRFGSSYLIGGKFVGRKWRIFLKETKNCRQIISPDKNFAWQSFAQQDNHNLFKWLVTLFRFTLLQLKTLVLLLGELFIGQKWHIFYLVAKISPNESFARQSFAR